MCEMKCETVAELAKRLSLEKINEASVYREVHGGYVGDLLSWVMGRAPADCLWITVMSNINVIAVASLADVACVVLAEGVALDSDALEAAKSRGINVFGSKLSAFELARLL